MTEEPWVRVTGDGPVRVLALNRPATSNALEAGLVEALRAEVEAAPDGGARALVIRGEGKHFCAGAHLGELGELAGAGESERLADARRLAGLYRAVLRSPLLTVAAVQGAAYGGGLGLAGACDLVVAAPAARLQFSEVRLGFVPALISVFLPRRVALARLAALFLDPRALTAEEGAAAGLVDEVAEKPLGRAVERAREVAARAAPSAIAATKRLLLELHHPGLDEALEEAARVNAGQRAHPECRRGVAAFLASRSFPDWSAPGQ